METNVQEELGQGRLPNFGVSERTRASLPRALTQRPLNSQVVLIQIQLERQVSGLQEEQAQIGTSWVGRDRDSFGG